MTSAEYETPATPEVRTLAERVFHQLQDAIVRGELAPGSKITEPGLSKAYGISRGPLREAMRRLEAHRLIERVPHVGARVVKLSMKAWSRLCPSHGTLSIHSFTGLYSWARIFK